MSGWSHWTLAQLETEQALWREALARRERQRDREKELLAAAKKEGREREAELRRPRLDGDEGLVQEAEQYLEFLATEVRRREPSHG